MKNDNAKWLTITIVSVWLTIFSLIPHLFILISSLLQNHENNLFSLTILHYINAFDPLYLQVFWRSFRLAGICTLLCLLIAYPFAYILARLKYPYRNLLFVFVLVPLWTNSLIRTYAIIAILKTNGILNTILLSSGIIKVPYQWLYTQKAVLIGLVYDLLPFMILPLYTSFIKLDQQYINVARDLGANKTMILMRVIIPLTLPGILSGSFLVFITAMSLFYIPDILGGGKSLFVGNLIQRKFLTGNWGVGSALSMMLFIVLIGLLWLGKQIQRQPRRPLNFL